MKKKIFLNFLILILIIIMIPITSIATTLEEVLLKLHDHRYINGEEKQGYAYNTLEGEDRDHHIIFQIMDKENNKKTNYYCLNATAGTTWNNGTVNTDIPYKSYYDLNLRGEEENGIAELKNDNDLAYSSIAGDYFNQIWWILNNIYIPTGEEEKDNIKREEFLNFAGIISDNIVRENSDEVLGVAYKYVPSQEANYTIINEGIDENAIEDKDKALEGWYYYNEENSFVRVDIQDELIEVASQAAIWYYTNYLNVPVEERNEEYNIRKYGLKLLCSTGTEGETNKQWKPLREQNIIQTEEKNPIYTGIWLEDQATILSWYLIDEAQKYADKFIEKNTDNPLIILNPEEKINIQFKHIVNNNECYIIGPIQINEDINQIYKLNDEIKINTVKCDEYNILLREGMQTSLDKKISDKIGQEFYISIPITWIENNVSKNEQGLTEFSIQFEGTYNFNEKKLRKAENTAEQPVVEINPNERIFNLNIEAVINENNPPIELDGEFDLAMKKYISSVYSKGDLKEEKQEPKIDTSDLAEGKIKSAIYEEDKTPIMVKQDDYVVYSFTVYNEGDVDAVVSKVTDNIPKGLQFIYIAEDGQTVISCDSNGDSEILTVDDEVYKLINEYNTFWALDAGENGLRKDIYNNETDISISCDIESFLGSKKILKSYKGIEDTAHNGENLDKLTVKVVLKVDVGNDIGNVIRNEAAITEAQDSYGNIQDSLNEQGEKILQDRDSQTDNWLGKNVEKQYQDDEDYDTILLGTTDLALKKFIIAVSTDLNIENGEYITEDGNIGSKENPYLRAKEVNTLDLKNKEECHDVNYITDKNTMLIPANSYVLYNIRIYNEGETDLYAGEITDKLPEYLDYVDCKFNRNYRWQLESDGKTIKTDYLSYNYDNVNNILKAFDKKTDDGKGSNLDYKDVQILCKINEKTPSGEKLMNTAEITKYEDEDGKKLTKDVDSFPENMEIKDEDDGDYEQILVQTFDLSLSKFVNSIYMTENGGTEKTEIKNTGDDKKDIIPKIEIDKKKLQNIVVRVGYTIKVTNEGDIPGYVKEITDYIPEGFEFSEEDNIGWINQGEGRITTKALEERKIEPGESVSVSLILRWINEKNNLNLKTNLAEISAVENESGIPDRDSIPNNKEEKEDDIDNAQVLIAISTGLLINLKTVLFIIIGIGGFGLLVFLWIILIRKYMM